MKLRNKKTGEIIRFYDGIALNGEDYDSLAELNEEWEDYEGPEEIWYIDWKGDVRSADIDNTWEDEKRIGNYFETKEEAKKAVEKLKAWKRLKDKGFRFDLWDYDGGNYQERIKTGRILFKVKDYEKNDKDLDLLFGGEQCEN